MPLHVDGDHGLDGGSPLDIEMAFGRELIGQWAGLVARPGLEGADELGLIDQANLKRE
jgi:hypothetical protein